MTNKMPCGCEWELVPVPPEHVAERIPDTTYSTVRYLSRCEVHAEMCRPLDEWELDIHEQ